MENRIPSPKTKSGGGALCLLVAVLCAAATAFLPVGFLLVPGLLAYAMFRTRPWFLIPLAASFLLPTLLLFSPFTAGCLTLLLAGVAAVLYVLSKNRLGNAYTVLFAGCVASACLYCALCLPGILSGAGAFAAVQEGVDQMLALSREALIALAQNGANPEAVSALDSYYRAVSAAVPTYVVPAVCCGSGLLALSNLLFFRLFAKKRAAEFGLAPLRPFRLWQIPRSIVYGLFALLAGSLILEWTGWGYAEGLSATVSAIALLPLMLQGLCVVDFMLYRSGKNVSLKRTLTYLVVGLLFSFLQTPLLMLGGFDQLFHFRARMTGGPPVQPLNRL